MRITKFDFTYPYWYARAKWYEYKLWRIAGNPRYTDKEVGDAAIKFILARLVVVFRCPFKT